MVMKNRELKAASKEDSDAGDDSSTSLAKDESESEEESKPEEEEEEEEVVVEEEEEEEEEVPNPIAAQRKATMPAAESDSLPAPISKPNPTAAKRKTVKRALPLDDTEGSKSKKKKAKKEEVEGIAAVEEEEGKKLLHRLWGEDDEITLLQGMVDYKEEKGIDPMADKADFYDFVKESLHVDVDKKQVTEKVRKLKRRHLNYLNKESLTPASKISMLKSPTPASKISMLIWGAAVVDKQTTKVNNKPAVSTTTMANNKPAGNDDFGIANTNTDNDNGLHFIGKGCVKIMGLDEEYVKLGLELCSDQSKREIEEEWKQLFLEEAALIAKKLKLACKESKLVTDALDVD